MQGIKFQLDPNSIARTKEEFNKFIQELENNSKINIKVNDKIFQELNTQISQTNGQLQNLVNKNNEVANSFASISSKTKGNKLFDVNSFVEYNNAIDKIKEKYSQLGQVNVTNKSFNPITKELESFSISVEKADGVIQKLKYDMQTVNGNKGFALNNFKEVDNTAKIREKQLQTEQKINRQIEQQNQRLNEQVTKSQDSINAIQMQWQQKINGLFAKDIIPKDKILQLENMIKNINLGTTKSDMQVIKGQYSNLVKLEQQLVAEKNKERDATKATMEAYVREQDRIAKMGTFKAKLPTQNIFKDNEALKSYIKSLYDAEAKITSFANSTKNAEQAQKTITVTTRNANNEIRREKIVIDEATQSIYKQSESISNNASRMKGFGDSMKSAFGGLKSYMSTMLGLYAIIGQIRNGLHGLSEINKVQTNIRMITGMNREQVQGLTKDFSTLAGELYTTNKEIMNGAESFMRAGKSIEATRNLLKASTIGSAISGQNNKETSEQLIAISNGFKMNAENAKEMMNIVDTLSTIDNNASTSFAELAEGMSRTSSSAQMAGTDMKTLASYIGVVSSTTRKSANSIGESFKSLFARYQDIKQGKKFDAENEALGNVEISLNKVGVAIRKDATHFRAFSDVINDLKGKWKSLSDIQKADISKSLAGTRQRENFLVLMDNLDQVDKLQDKIKNSAGSAEQKFNEAYGESTEAKINKLKHSVEEFWMSVTSSSTINHLVGGVTTIVQGLTQITQSGIGTKLAIAGLGFTLLITTKHFGGFIKALITGKGMIGGVSTELSAFQIIMKLFTASEITATTATGAFTGAITSLKGAMTALFATPAGLIFLAISSAIGVATYAIIKHMKKQKELKQKNEELSKSYKDLTTAIKNNNITEIKSSADNVKKEQKKLQDLIKQQKELQKSMANHEVATSVKGGYARNKSQEIYETNKAIEEQIKALKQAGFHVDEITGKIQELSQAENELKVNGFFEHVQGLAQEQAKYKKEIVALWREYQTLSAVENKNENQKYRLKQITDDLKRYMGDLTVETNKNGVATINNTELVGKQIDALDTENVSIDKLIDIKIQQAQQTQICEGNMTKCVYAEVGNRIKAYQSEIGALQAIRGLAFNKTYMMTGGDKIDSLAHQFGLKTGSEQIDGQIKARQDEINLLKDKEKEWNDRVDKLKNSLVAPSAPSHPNYSPQDVRGSSSKRKGSSSGSKSKYSTDNTKYTYTGQALNAIDGIIKTINDSIEQTDNNIESLTQKIANLQSLESKSNYNEIIEQENKKLEQQRLKVDKLQSAQKQANEKSKQIQSEIWKHWTIMNGKDLSQLTTHQWDEIYNKLYGKEINFGSGKKAEQWKEKYEKGAKLFQEMRKDYENTRELFNKSAQDELKMEQEINATIKERVELQKSSYDEQLRLKQQTIDLAQSNLDLFNIYEKENIDYIKKAQLTSDIISQQKSYLIRLVGIRNEITKQKNALQENTLEWNLLNSLSEEYNNKINDSNKTLQQTLQTLDEIRQTQLNELSNMQEKIVNALKKRYEEELKLAKEKKAEELLLTKNLTEEQLKLIKDGSKTALEIFEEEHQKKIDLLNEELKSYEEIYNAKIREIDDKESEDKYSTELNKKQQDKSKLQAQHDELLMDSTLEAKAKRASLLEDIKKKQEEIDDFQHNRDIILRKQNLKDTLDAQRKKIQNKIDEENKAYKKAKDLYDKEVKALEEANKDKLKSEKLYAQAREMLMQNSYDELNKLLVKYGDDSERIFGVMGKTIKEQICDNLKYAIDLMQNFNTLSDKNKWQQAVGYDKGHIIADYDKPKGMTYFGDRNRGTYNWDNISKDKEYNDLTNEFLNAKRDDDTEKIDSIRKKMNDIVGKYKKHKDGGLNVSTGFHWLDGTDTKPELVLNADQTQAMLGIKDYLPKALQYIQQPKIKLPEINLPQMHMNKQQPIIKVEKLLNVEGNIDKTVLPKVEHAGNNLLSQMKKEFNQLGIYRNPI